ncbi:hypothetical protein Q7C36_003529 [Tachysurus vachellii]|uniref:Uncharacterized protein n=1 Tax=Tachysurus vachellii TaxID=175792 RepID=A0AA88T9C1_TACVA|nr:hypothetical protein Q7C36_003529 [Tachysurus vachellii]
MLTLRLGRDVRGSAAIKAIRMTSSGTVSQVVAMETDERMVQTELLSHTHIYKHMQSHTELHQCALQYAVISSV